MKTADTLKKKGRPLHQPVIINQCWDCENYAKEESFSAVCNVSGAIVPSRKLAKWNAILICPNFINRLPEEK